MSGILVVDDGMTIMNSIVSITCLQCFRTHNISVHTALRPGDVLSGNDSPTFRVGLLYQSSRNMNSPALKMKAIDAPETSVNF